VLAFFPNASAPVAASTGWTNLWNIDMTTQPDGTQSVSPSPLPPVSFPLSASSGPATVSKLTYARPNQVRFYVYDPSSLRPYNFAPTSPLTVTQATHYLTMIGTLSPSHPPIRR
jgi:hypothetical protein